MHFNQLTVSRLYTNTVHHWLRTAAGFYWNVIDALTIQLHPSSSSSSMTAIANVLGVHACSWFYQTKWKHLFVLSLQVYDIFGWSIPWVCISMGLYSLGLYCNANMVSHFLNVVNQKWMENKTKSIYSHFRFTFETIFDLFIIRFRIKVKMSVPTAYISTFPDICFDSSSSA